jgi:hypothetical protein
MKSRLSCLFILLVLCAAAVASAAVIGFEGVPTYVIPATPYSEQGYLLQDTGWADQIISPGTGMNDNGTNIFGWCSDSCGGKQTLTLSAGGATFSFYSLDAAFLDTAGGADIESLDGLGPQSLAVTGYFALGGSISQTFAISETWTTFLLDGFNGLSSVEIQDFYAGTDPAIDNLVLSNVPEPGTWLLFSAGLAAMGALRRTRRS